MDFPRAISFFTGILYFKSLIRLPNSLMDLEYLNFPLMGLKEHI